VLAALLDNSGPLGRDAWGVLDGEAWLRFLDARGLLREWLADADESRLCRTLGLLTRLQPVNAKRVGELIAPYMDMSEQWRDRLLFIAQYSQEQTALDPWVFELMLGLVEDVLHADGMISTGLRDQFWDLVRRLATAGASPELAC